MTETSIGIRPAVAAAAHEPSGRRPSALASIALFAALVVLAGVVLVPLIATALGGFKELGDLQSQSVRRCRASGCGRTTGTS